jgi:phospholipase/carboxylesterase
LSPGRDLSLIHRYLPGTSPTTLLLLHGTGGNENDLIPLGRELDPEAGLLSPRGRVLEGGMPRWFRRLSPGVFDVDDLKARTHELAAFLEDAIVAYALDPARMVAVGYSNGANIAASLLLLHHGLLSAAVLLHAMVPFEPDDAVDLASTPVFLTAGRVDPMVPGDQVEELARLLEDAKADLVLQMMPGGHELSRAELDAAQRWLSVQAAGGSQSGL